ncbi:MAG: LptE family protein [Candidatus Neomarinimicrobiota bacterium]
MKKILVSAAALLVLAGCGYYSLAGSIPPHIRNIAIPLVENQTAEFGMAEAVTDNLQTSFTRENILRLVDEDQSDSVLRGTITRVEDKAQTFTGTEVVTEYRFTVTMKVVWYDVKMDKALLDKTYSGWGAYGLSGDIANDGIDNDGDGLVDGDDDDEFGEPRTYATRIAVDKIAEQVLNDIMTTW